MEVIMSINFLVLAALIAFSLNAQADANDVARINREVAAYQKGKAIDNAISERRILPGMTEEQVVQAKGYPTKRNDNGGNVQFVYPNAAGGTDYVYLRNGKTY